MSLNWNLNKIANTETTCWNTDSSGEEVMRGITHTLIFATMAVDLGEITAKNVDEWLVRVQVMARVSNDHGWLGITREKLVAHIGLNTNVSNKTRKQFMGRMAKVLESRCVTAARDTETAAG